MQTLELDLVEKLDSDDEIGALLRFVSERNLKDRDNTEAIEALAEKKGITPEAMFSYFWLQNYIDEMTESFAIVPDISVVAQQFGIDFDQFQEYIDSRSGWRNRPHLLTSFDNGGQAPLLLEGPSDEERAIEDDVLALEDDFDVTEAQRRGLPLEEYREFVEDLCEDAGLQG